jgi:hypothetical protein
MGVYEGEPVFIIAVSMHAKTNKDEPQPFSYTIEKNGKIYREVPISAVTPASLAEAEDKKEDKEEAKKKKEDLKKLDAEWKKKLKTGDID